MSLALEGEFVGLLRQILINQGFAIIDESRQYKRPFFRGSAPDLLVSLNGSTYVIEVKIYRTQFVPGSLLRNAVDQLSELLVETGADYGICVVTAPLKFSRAENIRKDSRVQVWDLLKLNELTLQNEELTVALSSFVRKAGIGTLIRETPPLVIQEIEQRAAEFEVKNEGARLSQQIQICPIGRNGATQFEKICEKALRYLFDDQVGKWTPQKSASDGMHRYDLVARLAPTHDFWVGLSRDFRSRYIIFEFKNYSAKIGQDQIYTTEKYLFITALRAVSIIVSRKGADKNAERAIRGALRESGKLILSITSEDLCRALVFKDNGDDPTDIFVDRLDQLLTEIGR